MSAELYANPFRCDRKGGDFLKGTGKSTPILPASIRSRICGSNAHLEKMTDAGWTVLGDEPPLLVPPDWFTVEQAEEALLTFGINPRILCVQDWEDDPPQQEFGEDE
jgi:hypothetical protein